MARCWIDFHDPKKTVILAGCGRSGTTWLGDVMNYRNTFRVMFEPFFPDKVPALEGWWNHRQYVRPDVTEGRHADLIRTMLAGRIADPWIDQFNTRRFATRRLIKDIRINFLLTWIRTHQPEIPVVFLLRHPIPTALSQLKMGWPPEFRPFLEQPELMADFLEPFRGDMEAARDPFEARILLWCLMNWVPLRQFAAGGLHVIFYEDLCKRQAAVLPGLFAHIGVRHTDWVLDTLWKPSALTIGASSIAKGEDPVESWPDQVTPDQVAAAMRILRRFGMDRIYGEATMPRVPAEQVLGLFKG
jgi:hypothetical protein